MKYTSQIIASGSGSVGGCVYSRNHFGSYIRNRSVPINPGSSQQSQVRSFMSALVARWTSTLTAEQRTAWDSWAAQVAKQGFSGTYFQTGQNAYIGANLARRAPNVLAYVDDPPADFAGTPLTPPGITSADESSNLITVTFTNTDEWATAQGGGLFVYQGRPQNPSRTFYKGPYRYLDFVAGDTTPPTSPSTFTPAFPFIAGQLVPMQFRAVSADGKISAINRNSIIAVA